MKANNIGKIQLIVAIAAVVYLVMPDFPGLVDDSVIATIAGIIETVLSVMKAISNKDTNNICSGQNDI